MENADFTDLELIYYVRDSLTAVMLGERENYDELVGYLHPKMHLNPDEVALLVTTLKALCGAVTYIDSFHHEALLFAVSRMSFWNYGTDVMDSLIELVISLGRGVDKKNKVLSRVHAAFKDIADLVTLSPLRLCPIVVQRMPSVFSKEPEIVIYMENMLRLESGAIGEIVGGTMLPALVDGMIELDASGNWMG